MNDKPPKIDGKQFKQTCYSIVNNYNDKIIEFNEPIHARNFYHVIVDIWSGYFQFWGLK